MTAINYHDHSQDPAEDVEPILNSMLSVLTSLATEEGMADASGDAMIPRCDREIDEPRSSSGRVGKLEW